MCLLLGSDQISDVSLRVHYPQFIGLKWLLLCSKPASAGGAAALHCSRQQTECTQPLCGADGTNLFSKGSTVPALTEDLLADVCSRGIFQSVQRRN